MPTVVRVSTGSRLHFGLLAVNAPTGRQFGGAGLMIEFPGCELRVSRSEFDEVVASHELSPRLSRWRDRVRRTCDPASTSFPVRIEATRELPSHSGLGSGTQSALALATALEAMWNLAPRDPAEWASSLERGGRSAIGVHGFRQGGFLLEAGKRSADEISPLVSRVLFPPAWRLLLARPRSTAGLSGDAERQAFAKLGSMPSSMTERLCRIALMELLPAVQQADFETASSALREFGRLNGEFFAAVQGGIFADSRVARLADWLQAAGCTGFGQSSWGPTLFALMDSDEHAVQLSHELQASPLGQEFDWHVTKARNCGASVVVE